MAKQGFAIAMPNMARRRNRTPARPRLRHQVQRLPRRRPPKMGKRARNIFIAIARTFPAAEKSKGEARASIGSTTAQIESLE